MYTHREQRDEIDTKQILNIIYSRFWMPICLLEGCDKYISIQNIKPDAPQYLPFNFLALSWTTFSDVESGGM